MDLAPPDLPKPAPHARPRTEDDVSDLPPLDGDAADGEPSDEHAGPFDESELIKDDGGDPFDDATGEGDALPEIQGPFEVAEGVSFLDAAEADALDIGAHDLVGEEGERLSDDGHEGREEDRPHEDYGLAEDPHTAIDAGEEGPETDDEALSDAGLPPLDQDDDGAQDAAEAFFEGDLLEGPHGRQGPQGLRVGGHTWSARWERFGAPLTLPPCRALSRVRGGVLSVGREIVRVELEGATERLPARGLLGGEATRVIVAGKELFVTTERGGLFVSRDGGASFEDVPGWRELVRPEEAAAGLDVVASQDGTLWGRTAQGSLLSCKDHGEHWEKGDVDGFVHALGVDEEGNALVLVRGLAASEVLRRSGDGGQACWLRVALPAGLLGSSLKLPASIVAHGKSIAIAVDGAGVFRSVLGAVWSRLAGTGAVSVTAMAMLDESGTVVVGLHGSEDDDEDRDGTRLARVGADGELSVVFAWDEQAEGEAGVTAIAVDEAHEVVWVGGGFGVAAFQPKMPPLDLAHARERA